MKLIYLLSEAVTIEVGGTKPERLLNELTRRNICFTDAEKTDTETLRLTILNKDAVAFADAACLLRLDASIIRRSGLFKFLKRFKKRYVLIALPLLLLAAVFYLSTFIWELDITGNLTLPRSVIFEALEECGVGIGTNGLHLNNEIIRSEMIYKIKKLSWLTVRVNGSRALVVVRERRDKPELIDEKLYTNILSAKTGIIEKVTALSGKALVKEGDLILQGQTLISGELSDKQGQLRHVRALGEVWARTWYEKTLTIPLNNFTKQYTEKECKQYSVIICNLRLNFYFNSSISYEYYDKISTEKRPEIFGLALPVSVITNSYREYRAVRDSIAREAAEELLKDRLLQWVAYESGGAELKSADFTVTEDRGFITVSVLAECYEQIGKTKLM
jgi:similar to stage IV sporulation protein